MTGATWMDVSKKVPEKTKSDASHVRLARNLRIGKYRLEKRVGKGGYCEVWKARDCIEGIWVALKIPNKDIHGKRDNKTLLREIRLVAQLRHPHIMPVKNAEMINGYAVLASELSTGTLSDCSKPMGIRRLLSIIMQVLEGLSHAHSKKMVHCDVSPSNIFLFPNGKAAIGDFGISFEMKGRQVTIDEFGTPGYVAPEQAYGRPTYRSDCFSVGLILYEYLTGVLPRWPFTWPCKGYDRLKQRTSNEFVKFMKKALAIDPKVRYANAHKMLEALRLAIPTPLRKSLAVNIIDTRKTDWKQLRRETFIKRYKKLFPSLYECVECGEPISESMQICPWCGTHRNKFHECTLLSHYCPDCKRGVLPEWKYCPWCREGRFDPQEKDSRIKYSYQDKCRFCKGKMARFMKYCPWCHKKAKQTWKAWPMPNTCSTCGCSVDTNYWIYCPWCKQTLTS